MDFNSKKGFICDMDGVIYHGSIVLPGVAEFISWLKEEKKEYLFLTNNSGYTPKELQQKLSRLGLDVPEITRVFLKLYENGFDVPTDVYTVEDAKTKLIEFLNRGKVNG